MLSKLDEAVAQLRIELESGARQARIEDEFGDVMFVIASLAWYVKVNLQQVARAGNHKFERRSRGMEALAALQGTTLADLDRLAQMARWRQLRREGG